MLILLAFIILSATLWVSFRNLIRTIDAQGSQLHAEGLEFRLQLAAIHRVLLDSLKPDWWVKLTQMMKEIDEAEDRFREKRRKRDDTLGAEEKHLTALKFSIYDELAYLPAHAVDPYVWALALEAYEERTRIVEIKVLLESGKDALTDTQREKAERLLRECQQAADEVASRELPESVLPSEPILA